jgi:hypothetical protein
MKRTSWAKVMILAAIFIIAVQSGVLAERSRDKKTLDTVVEWKDGKVCFFKGGRYVRFDMKDHRVDPDYPKPINNETWPGLPWTDGIEAAINLGNGKAYFFKGDQYVRWDIAADRIDPGYPKAISTPSAWPGLPWTDGFDAAINLGNGNYIFLRAENMYVTTLRQTTPIPVIQNPSQLHRLGLVCPGRMDLIPQ